MWHKLIFAGRLGRDPEMRYTPEGQPVTSFSVGVQDGSGEYKKTIWVRVSAWGKQAEACNQYLRKGERVLVEGRLLYAKNGGPRLYQRQDGTMGSSFEVNAVTVRFLESKAEKETSAEMAGEADDEDIPF